MAKSYDPRTYWKNRLEDLGDTYVGRRGQSSDEVQRQMESFWTQLQPLVPQPCGKVLDFGCGVGRLAPYLSPKVESYVGVDLCQEALEIAPQLDNVEYIHLSEDALPFADASFNLITSITVIQHIVEESQYRLWCSELRRVLKPEGQFLIIDNTKKALSLKLLQAKHVRDRSPDEIVEALGARIVSQQIFTAEKKNSHCCFVAVPINN